MEGTICQMYKVEEELANIAAFGILMKDKWRKENNLSAMAMGRWRTITIIHAFTYMPTFELLLLFQKEFLKNRRLRTYNAMESIVSIHIPGWLGTVWVPSLE